MDKQQNFSEDQNRLQALCQELHSSKLEYVGVVAGIKTSGRNSVGDAYFW
jgi:hypothetical protein